MSSPPNGTREIIISSAIKLFSENGFTETTMKDIAKASNIKPASIYNHFASKKQILESIFDIYSNLASNKIPLITETYIKSHEAKDILNNLFFVFDQDTSLMYQQILKIFLQEQYRIAEARYFMKVQYIEDTQKYIKHVLDKMVEYGKISPINTAIFAEIFHSINIKATVAAGHYINEGNNPENDHWGEALSLVINIILNS